MASLFWWEKQLAGCVSFSKEHSSNKALRSPYLQLNWGQSLEWIDTPPKNTNHWSERQWTQERWWGLHSQHVDLRSLPHQRTTSLGLGSFLPAPTDPLWRKDRNNTHTHSYTNPVTHTHSNTHRNNACFTCNGIYFTCVTECVCMFIATWLCVHLCVPLQLVIS